MGRFIISGTTRDGAGAPLGECAVRLFDATTHVLAQSTTSDGNGAYSFTVTDSTTTHYIVAYKAGATDVFGTCANTVTGT